MTFLHWNQRLSVYFEYLIFFVKDARSVSWYPYNRSHILQYVKYTKWINIGNGIAFVYINNEILDKKEHNNNRTKRKLFFLQEPGMETGTTLTLQSGVWPLGH